MSPAYMDITDPDFWTVLVDYTVNIIGIISGLTALYAFTPRKVRSTKKMAIVLAVVMTLLLGLYPIGWGSGSDRANYAAYYFQINTSDINSIGDYGREAGFTLLNLLLGRIFNVNQYFIVIAIIYISNYYIASYNLARRRVFWLFIAVVLSMGFITYYTNTMRAGLALSFVMLGLSMYPSKVMMLIFMAMAGSIHNSSLLPSAMILISCTNIKLKYIYILWFLAIPVSFLAGDFFNTLFSGLSEDPRTSYLTQSNTQYHIGFRLDFILYSLVPMAVGAFYIFKRKFQELFYTILYKSYLLSNLLWILIIRANFSDRFAYLSWFMIPFILVYPLLKKEAPVPSPGKWLAVILLGETTFGLILQ